MGDLELHLPPNVAYVSLARLVVCAAARLAGMDDERVEDLRIAVSEATTNAVAAHLRASQPQPVTIEFGDAGSGTFEVTIADAGPGFQPSPPQALAERGWDVEGGLGVTIIRNLADEVRFDRDGGMRVSMRFTLDGWAGLQVAAAADTGEVPVP